MPISLVISLAQTLRGLHWDQIPGDNDDEVAARGILYLLIFQQLGQLVRWSWGYHVLLAPAEKYDETASEDIEGGRYRDEPELIPGLDGPHGEYDAAYGNGTDSTTSFESGGRTPVTHGRYAGSDNSDENEPRKLSDTIPTPANGNILPGNIVSFPAIRNPTTREEQEIPAGIWGIIPTIRLYIKRGVFAVKNGVESVSSTAFRSLPESVQTVLAKVGGVLYRFFAGLWEFMNPPLWAMLIAVVVASIPKLQQLFFEDGSFIANSVTRAIGQSGGVAVPLILVVLGANL